MLRSSVRFSDARRVKSMVALGFEHHSTQRFQTDRAILIGVCVLSLQCTRNHVALNNDLDRRLGVDANIVTNKHCEGAINERDDNYAIELF